MVYFLYWARMGSTEFFAKLRFKPSSHRCLVNPVVEQTIANRFVNRVKTAFASATAGFAPAFA